MQAGEVVPRLAAQQEAHAARPIGEAPPRSASSPTWVIFVDGERQHVGRQSVAVTGQRLDQRRAMRFVMDQQHRIAAAGVAIDA